MSGLKRDAVASREHASFASKASDEFGRDVEHGHRDTEGNSGGGTAR